MSSLNPKFGRKYRGIYRIDGYRMGKAGKPQRSDLRKDFPTPHKVMRPRTKWFFRFEGTIVQTSGNPGKP